MPKLQEETKLNKIEKELKGFFLAYPSRHLELPCEQDSVRDILDISYSKASSKVLQNLQTIIVEGIFISHDLDIAFVRHIRYTPAFWHEHDFFELLYVIKGHCTNTMLHQSISMKTGDICIIAPGTTHAVSAFCDDTLIFNILIRKSTFEQSFLGLLEGDDILSDFFKRTFYQNLEIPYLLFHTENDSLLQDYVNEAYSEYLGKRRYKKQMLNALLSRFFITLFRNHEQTMEVPHIRFNSADESLMYILRYMQANYTTLSLKELAQFFNYSQRQIQRIIKNATGMTFKENIQKQKMTKAAALLTDSSLSISKICELTGFQSLHNFRKSFYKYYQMTPSQFRKKEKKL